MFLSIFFVNNLLSWRAGKILVESIQFSVKIGGFFLSSFIGFLLSLLLGIERIIIAAGLFNEYVL